MLKRLLPFLLLAIPCWAQQPVTVVGNLPAGTNVIGHVINDASTAVIGHVIVDSGTITAVTAITNALPAGTNVIGHVITDSGSVTNATLSAETTKVIGTVNQGTSPWVVSNGGTFAVQCAACALETGGNLATIVTNTNKIPSLGQALAAASVPVVLTAAQLTTLTPLTTVAVTQSTSPWIVAGGGTAGSAATGVITVQGIASMTKLLVTPDSVALPANQSVNVSQLNGHTTVECGVNGCLSVGGNIADGSALSSNNDPIVIAGKGSGNARVPIVCDNWTPFSLASTTSLKLVAKVSSKQVYICSINIVSAAANNVALIEGTKTTTDCDTSTAGMAGGTTAATGWNFAANGGLTQGSGFGVVMATATANHDVCLLASGSGQLSGAISWTQF